MMTMMMLMMMMMMYADPMFPHYELVFSNMNQTAAERYCYEKLNKSQLVMVLSKKEQLALGAYLDSHPLSGQMIVQLVSQRDW